MNYKTHKLAPKLRRVPALTRLCENSRILVISRNGYSRRLVKVTHAIEKRAILQPSLAIHQRIKDPIR